MTKVYIAGPMTGYNELNYPLFAATAVKLRAMGFEVVSPAEINPITTPYREAMINDIKALIECDHILMLDNWKESAGASLEHHIARVLGISEIQLEAGQDREAMRG